ncbi:nucleotidyltransferase family protein [Bacillus thuringiensis]|uniref:nucleotidyltransferase family protein n=1 Tax=Bacillus thuringiensis TaxID=1428 RepID=UPI000BFA5B25|nr:NDP-sugar synthase [Bacillus thuringiensis]PFR37900.1 hypothetical protein COK27_21605 [Bacillus thuringiensis]PGL16713.1 hypothetical protein CN921_29130 [Bacillus thuringiensis]
MKCIILAAGIGARLKPFTNSKPKPMLSILDKPVLEHLINHLASVNITEIYINLHYKGDKIKEYFKDGKEFGVSIIWREQEELTGPAGSLLCFADLFKEDEDILIFSGDAVHDADINCLIEQHKRTEAVLTMLMKEVENPTGYGVGMLGSDSKILQFIEKPVGLKDGIYTVNCGIYCINSSFIKRIPEKTVVDFVDLANILIEENGLVYGHRTNNYWIDMGTPKNLLKANLDVLRSKINKLMPKTDDSKQLWLEDGVRIHPSAKLIGPVYIGENCVIEKGSEIIGPAVIGANSIIKPNTHISSSVVFGKSLVPEETILYGGLYGPLQRNC